jgi:hypothetical protein
MQLPILMDFVLYQYEAPMLERFIRNVLRDYRTKETAMLEATLWKEYCELGSPHTQLIEQSSGSLVDEPEDEMFVDRLCSFGKKGRNPRVNEYIIRLLGQRAVYMTYSYLEVFEEYIPDALVTYPQEALLDIFALTNFPRYINKKYAKPDIAIVSLLETSQQSDPSMIFELANKISRDGKIFFIGPKEDIGSSILALAKSRTSDNYPFRGVVERGGWSLDYFVDEYVHKSGFSPHQNVVMTAMEKDMGKRPMCRIKEYGNNWLMKIDLGQKGWNPQD